MNLLEDVLEPGGGTSEGLDSNGRHSDLNPLEGLDSNGWSSGLLGDVLEPGSETAEGLDPCGHWVYPSLWRNSLLVSDLVP